MKKLLSKMRGARGGFSLIEVLFTVLILSVLSAVAVPLYSGVRADAAKKACLSNVRMLVSAENKYMLDNSSYTTDPTQLIGKGIAAVPTCPADGSPYTLQINNGALTISCSNPAHSADNTMTIQ